MEATDRISPSLSRPRILIRVATWIEHLQWDEFDTGDDHTVPYRSNEQQDGYVRAIVRDRDKIRGTMLEDGSRPYSPDGALHASRDSVPNKKASGTASEPGVTTNGSLRTNTICSVGEELCVGDSIFRNQVLNNTFPNQLNQVTEPAVRDLSFFDSAQQDKGNGDLLYYGWPEIETFEDVDKMFRSCDSTFGLGIDNEDRLSWFSSSHAIEESSDALKPDFIFPGPDSDTLNDATDCDKILRSNDSDCVINEGTHEKDLSICRNSSSETLYDIKTADVMNSSFENGSETTMRVEAGDQSMLKESQKLQTYGKRRGLNLENGESFNHLDKLNQMGDLTQHMGCSSSERTEYEQSTPLQIRNKPFTVKSEDNCGQSLFKNDTSDASNEVQHKGNCHSLSFQIPGVAGAKNKTQSHHGGSSLHHEHDAGLAVQSAYSDPNIPQKKIVNFESEVNGHSTVDESGPCITGELGSSNVQDSACLSSMVDEVSLEASSFLQLQHVIEKLDVKTKLCIRDSLYRLANSAQQRHKCSKLTISGGQGDGDESGILASNDTDKCTRFMDMETDTNPIDRSVAHLLFHRPSDISVLAAVDTIPLTKEVRNPGSEKPASHESSNDAGFGASTVE
ncbi:hypothetical protein V2J09_017635 [Rumex salicifolius]